MAQETSSALLYFLTKELEVLVSGKVEKIYQLGREDIIFRIYKDGEKKFFRICAPDFVSLTSQEFDSPMLPPGFCMFLRKYLTNARIEEIYQKEFERILVVKFSSKKEPYFLIIELFKPGNVILCRKEDLTLDDSPLIVINSFERQRFKDRLIQARKPYDFPPQLINPLTVSKEELVKLVSESDRNLVKTLASKLGLGGVYAEELIARAKMNKDASDLSLNDASKLIVAIQEFFSEKINPFILNESIFPVNMLTKEGEKMVSISEGFDKLSPFTKKDVSKQSLKKKEKTESLVEIQEKMIKNFERKIVENQEKGEFIYSHYQEFLKLINDSNKIRESDGLDALEAVMKSNKKFVSINKKDKELMLKF